MRAQRRTQKENAAGFPAALRLSSENGRLPGKARAQGEDLGGDRVMLCAGQRALRGADLIGDEVQPVLLPIAPEIGDEQREARCDRVGAASRQTALAPLTNQRREADVGGGWVQNVP